MMGKALLVCGGQDGHLQSFHCYTDCMVMNRVVSARRKLLWSFFCFLSSPFCFHWQISESLNQVTGLMNFGSYSE